MRLIPTVPNSLGNVDATIAIAKMLETPPPRLRMKPGPRNEPVKNEARTTLIMVTVIAVLNPKSINAVRVIIFDSPTLSHGMGIGMRLSNPCRARA